MRRAVGRLGGRAGSALGSVRVRLTARLSRLPARVADSDRIYAVALAVVVLVVAVMMLAPVRTLVEAERHVADLEQSQQRLRAQVARLEERRDALRDLRELELIAREELGMVKPGEVAFVVVSPNSEAREAREDDGRWRPRPRPWYRRLLEAVFD
ncbi:MAG: septum formation initiator family protein [Actinomycetota bacterium]|nr:septum formation initiator family protein [Actinomycetota bacterium]